MTNTTHLVRPVPSALQRRVALGFAALLALACSQRMHAQGCVPIKEMGDQTVSVDGVTTGSSADQWAFTESYEHFRSYLDYIGSFNNTPARNRATNQVINVVDQFDSSLSYTPDVLDTVAVDLPYFTATRSQLAAGVGRYKTRGRGIGDMRVTWDRWLLDPRTHPLWDISVGLGLSIPTGPSGEQGFFPSTSGGSTHSLDQSIQPGMGGWGLIGEFNGYYRFAATTSFYANGFYMATPQDTNQTRTTSAITSVTAYNSVYDQYELRGGFTQQIWKVGGGTLTGSFGGRWEGVPSLDLIGRSDGFRRPGYVISIEPGVAYLLPHDTITVSVPIAEYMNRTQSYSDMLNGGHGDAFFAKFLVLISYSHRW